MGSVVLKKKDAGFTLIEMMIALTVLLIGMLGIAAMLVTSIDANENNKRATEATYLAEQQLDIFRGTPYSAIPLAMSSTDTANNTYINVEGNKTPNESEPCCYTRWWVVNENSTQTLKDITVYVKWSYKGQSHQVVLASEKSA